MVSHVLRRCRVIALLTVAMIPLLSMAQEGQAPQRKNSISHGLEDVLNLTEGMIKNSETFQREKRDYEKCKSRTSSCYMPDFFLEKFVLGAPMKDKGICDPSEILVVFNTDHTLTKNFDFLLKGKVEEMCEKQGFPSPVEIFFPKDAAPFKSEFLKEVMVLKNSNLRDIFSRLQRKGVRTLGVSIRKGLYADGSGELFSFHRDYANQLKWVGVDLERSAPLKSSAKGPRPLGLFSEESLRDIGVGPKEIREFDLTEFDPDTRERVHASFDNGILMTSGKNISYSLRAFLHREKLTQFKCLVFVDHFADNLMDINQAFKKSSMHISTVEYVGEGRKEE